ncbi:hypothetical protein Dimus_023000 [Dionaea muscipula]
MDSVLGFDGAQNCFEQVIVLTVYIVTTLCLKKGMNHFVLVVYRHFATTFAIAPFALVLERKIRPKMTLSVFLKIMLLAFLEPLLQRLHLLVSMSSQPLPSSWPQSSAKKQWDPTS